MRFIFSSYIIIVVLTVLVIVVGFGFSRNLTILSRKAHDKELRQAHLERIEQSNEEAQANLDLLQDTKIIEQEARKRFNLKREGEQVVIIYPSQEENRREPLTDETFLQLYENQQQTSVTAEQEQTRESSFLDKVRSLLGNVIGGQEYVIDNEE